MKVIDVVSSFILDTFSVFAVLWNMDVDVRYSLFAVVGFCRSLITMSSFALETSSMIEGK